MVPEKARDTTAQTEWDPQHVGEGGVGRLWTPDDDGDAEELGLVPVLQALLRAQLMPLCNSCQRDGRAHFILIVFSLCVCVCVWEWPP